MPVRPSVRVRGVFFFKDLRSDRRDAVSLVVVVVVAVAVGMVCRSDAETVGGREGGFVSVVPVERERGVGMV